jgi:hypothetical protein
LKGYWERELVKRFEGDGDGVEEVKWSLEGKSEAQKMVNRLVK